jgi:hypothetical protein
VNGAGVEIIGNRKMEKASRGLGVIELAQFKLQTLYLEGVHGARSTVDRLFGLGRNRKFLTCAEVG